MPTTEQDLRCSICGKPSSLEDCKINERGLPVHESCYLAKLNAEKGATTPGIV